MRICSRKRLGSYWIDIGGLFRFKAGSSSFLILKETRKQGC
jgi:hypothetical protein